MVIHEVASLDDPRGADFSALPHAVYADDHIWSPESEVAVTWAFTDARPYAVVALEAGRPVARAAAFPGGPGPGEPVGAVGLFECLPGHEDAGRAVLRECESYLAARGAVRVRGPMSDPLVVGLQTAGFELPQTIFTPHNPPWYPEVFRQSGYREVVRMVAPRMTRDRVPELWEEVPGVVVRHIDQARLAVEIAAVGDLHRRVFTRMPGQPAHDAADTQRIVARLLPHADPELVILAEHDGQLIGSILCLPDSWQLRTDGHIDRARILSIGVLPGWKRRRVGMAMGVQLMRTLLRKGYQSAEAVWVRESNLAPRLLALWFGAESGREFAVLEKVLGS